MRESLERICSTTCFRIHNIWSNYSDLTHRFAPNGGLVREVPVFQENPGWWNIIICPDNMSCFKKCFHILSTTWRYLTLWVLDLQAAKRLSQQATEIEQLQQRQGPTDVPNKTGISGDIWWIWFIFMTTDGYVFPIDLFFLRTGTNPWRCYWWSYESKIWALRNCTSTWPGHGSWVFTNPVWVVATQTFLEFSSLFGEMIQFDQYFSDGLKPPTSCLFSEKCRKLPSRCPCFEDDEPSYWLLS